MDSVIQTVKTAKGFFQQVQASYKNQDSDALADLFHSLYNHPGYTALAPDKWKNAANLNAYQNIDNMSHYFSKVLQVLLQYLIERCSKGFKTAFPIHLKVIIAVLKCFEQIKQEQGDVWICKPLRKIVRATKKIFFAAYKASLYEGVGNKVKSDLLNTLQRFKTARTLSKQIKSLIIPLVDNMQVSIFANFHNYEQIQRIINAPRLYEFNKSHPDYYCHHFQKARFSLINQWITEADEDFKQVQLKTKKQKRLVLKYWIPCKIMLGANFQAKKGIAEECFPQYEALMKAITSANFSQYDEVVQRFQPLWIKRGLFLLMDRMKLIVWRNLLKKVYRILGQKIDFEMIEKAVRLAGGQESINECICIVSNLISEGYIKGYIFQSEPKRTLVLKKNNAAFPKLKSFSG